MKVFLDANIIMDFLGNREMHDQTDIIIKCAEFGAIDACVSASIIDNLVYLIGMNLKRQEVKEPEKRNKIRQMLIALLKFIDVVDISKTAVIDAISDLSFKDLEDSLQYHCALENKCDSLITINIKDFPTSNDGIEVLTPIQFVNKYIESGISDKA